MIDLSKFVNRRVLVNLRCGFEFTGFILPPDSLGPYMFAKDGGMIPRVRYTKDGRYDDIGRMSGQGANDIIQIEEIKPMSKYEDLKKQVAEMQKEIDRLEREEKALLNLKPVEITRTVRFTPQEYFDYCANYSEEPSETGYEDFYCNHETLSDCFSGGDYTQEIKVIK